jgi:hypothetical protein
VTDELRDYTTTPGWTRADADRFLDVALDTWITRRRWKYAPAYTPSAAPANVSGYWHGPQPATMICYSGTALDAVMQGRHDGGDWYNAYCERYRRAHPVSARDFAASCGLTGAAADMFAEIAGIIQNAREATPW